MPPDESGTPIDALQRQLRSVLDVQLAAFSIQYAAALDDARRRAREEADRAFAQQIDAVREEWAARLEGEVHSLRADADRRVAEATTIVRVDAERRATEAVAQARADAERQAAARIAETERRASEQIAQLRADIERSATDAIAQARADAERRAEDTIAQARADAERHAAETIAAARADVERTAADTIAQARAEAERQAAEAIARARGEADQKTADEIDQARAEFDRRAAEQIARARLEADAQSTNAIAQARAEAERQIADALAQARADAERSAAESIAQARGEIERHAVEMIEQTRAEAERDAADSIAQIRLEAERQTTELLGRTREDLERTLSAERIRAEHAIADERERAESALVVREVEAATARQTVRGVVAAIRALDHSTSLTHALETLTEHAAAVAGRAAVFVVSGDRLSSFRTAGFPSTSGTPYETSISGAGLLSHAVRGRDMQTSSIDMPPPAFAGIGSEHTSVAVPLSVGERVVAVLYADGATAAFELYGSKHGHAPNRDWVDAIDAMARHASLVLGAVTAARTVQAVGGRVGDALVSTPSRADEEERARRYARLLLSEIKLYNEPAIRLGRQQRDLLHRLRSEIDRARRLYEERVPPALGGRATYFQQELVQTLADGDAALLGATF